MDFSKAFDTVSHHCLLRKMHAHGINTNLLSWVSSFLKDRNQKVRVNDSYSQSCPEDSGITTEEYFRSSILYYFYNWPTRSCWKLLQNFHWWHQNIRSFFWSWHNPNWYIQFIKMVWYMANKIQCITIKCTKPEQEWS